MCGSTFVLSSWGWAQFWRKSWITWTVHFAKGRCLPQIQILWSVARTEESRSQATVLGNQQWRLHCLQNVVWGPPQHGMFRSAPMWNGVPRLKMACARVETARRPCRYFEHRPNMNRVSIVRKCLVRVMSPKSIGDHPWSSFWFSNKQYYLSHPRAPSDGGGHTSENRGVETYAYIHITYILLNASRQRVSRSTILSTNINSPKDGSNPKLPHKG